MLNKGRLAISSLNTVVELLKDRKGVLTEGLRVNSALCLILNKKFTLLAIASNAAINYDIVFSSKSSSYIVKSIGLTYSSYNLNRYIATAVKCRFIYLDNSTLHSSGYTREVPSLDYAISSLKLCYKWPNNSSSSSVAGGD